MPFNWLDITIIFFLVYSAMDGMSKGFLMSFLNIAGIFIALYFSNYFCSYLVGYILKNTHIINNLEKLFVKRINKVGFLTNYVFSITTGNQKIQHTVSLLFIKVACFLCLFVIFTLFINIFKDMIRGSVRRTPIKYADKLLGFIFGFIKGILIVFLFFAVITPVMTLLPKNSEILKLLDSSSFAKYFLMYNFVIPWIQKINLNMKTANINNLIKVLNIN